MGYRRGQYRKQRSSHRESQADFEPHGLVEMTATMIAQVFELLFSGVGWLWGKTIKRPVRPSANPYPNPSDPTPPPVFRPPSVSSVAHVPTQLPRTTLPPSRPLPRSALCDSLLTDGELAFFDPLHLAVDGRYYIFCKVRLVDVIRSPGSRREEGRWFRSIGRFHVDFVLCELKTTAPLLVIELDDRSHRDRKRRQRDAFKDSALRSAGLPLLRVPCQADYDVVYLAKRIKEMILPPTRR